MTLIDAAIICDRAHNQDNEGAPATSGSRPGRHQKDATTSAN